MLTLGDLKVNVSLPKHLRHIQQRLSDTKFENGAGTIQLTQ
jgi:hypothetical protein